MLAAQPNLFMMQCLLYWEQSLKPDVRAECKFDPVRQSTYMGTAKAQPAAIAVEPHLTAAAEIQAASRRRVGGAYWVHASV